MTDWERGFLLLTCPLGDPGRKPLTTAQFRTLTRRVRQRTAPREDRDLVAADLLELGYAPLEADRILRLLAQKPLLEQYLAKAQRYGCYAVARNSRQYPKRLRQLLGEDAPASLWLKGDSSLLETPMISVVGSRDLFSENRRFAERIGQLAAREGYTLVSGNARGADRVAQDACLAAGGRVISVVADKLYQQHQRENMLYISENSFDSDFSATRALSRNHVIHALGSKVFVAQCSLGKGGTWSGTYANLKNKRTQVVCFADGSAATAELCALGATTADNTIEKL
ncbi:MAG: DNA-protecting protein DprA [Oscillospiraceae bacterium]|nr:DNA-protecting protein DprA [Oscillospiraceae bacterium]